MVDGVGWRVEARLKMSSSVSRFNGSIIVGMKVTGQYPKLQLVKRRMGRSGSNLGTSAYQPSTASLGQLGLFPLLLQKYTTCIVLHAFYCTQSRILFVKCTF